MVFTIIRAGINKAEARAQGLDLEVRTTDMSDWYSVERVGERHAAVKVLLEEGTARILGAHLLGPEAAACAAVAPSAPFARERRAVRASSRRNAMTAAIALRPGAK